MLIHSPCWKQFPLQASKPQWKPLNPGWQTQVPLMHCPCSLQRSSQAFKLHLGPLQPGLQTQEEPKHWPFGPQSKPQTAKLKIRIFFYGHEKERQFQAADIGSNACLGTVGLFTPQKKAGRNNARKSLKNRFISTFDKQGEMGPLCAVGMDFFKDVLRRCRAVLLPDCQPIRRGDLKTSAN